MIISLAGDNRGISGKICFSSFRTRQYSHTAIEAMTTHPSTCAASVAEIDVISLRHRRPDVLLANERAGEVFELDEVAGTLRTVDNESRDALDGDRATGLDEEAEHPYPDALDTGTGPQEAVEDTDQQVGVLVVLLVARVGVDIEVGAAHRQPQVDVEFDAISATHVVTGEADPHLLLGIDDDDGLGGRNDVRDRGIDGGHLDFLRTDVQWMDGLFMYSFAEANGNIIILPHYLY